MSKRNTKFTAEEKTRWVQLVDRLRETVNPKTGRNYSIKEACAKVSKDEKRQFSYSLYVWWKGHLEGRPRQTAKPPTEKADFGAPQTFEIQPRAERPSIMTVPTKDGRLVAFMGDTKTVLRAIREMVNEEAPLEDQLEE